MSATIHRIVLSGLFAFASFAIVLLPGSASALTFSTTTATGGLCVTAGCDAHFSLPADAKIVIDEQREPGDDVNISRIFDITHVDGGSVFAFQSTNTPSEYSKLDFIFSGAGLKDGGFIIDGIAAALTTQTFGVFPNSVFTITVDGTYKGTETGQWDISLSVVPIPPALLLFASALFGLGILGRTRRKAAGGVA